MQTTKVISIRISMILTVVVLQSNKLGNGVWGAKLSKHHYNT